MKTIYKYILILILLIVGFGANISAQPISQSSMIRNLATLPSPNTCTTTDKNQRFIYVTATEKLYKCAGGTYVEAAPPGGGGGASNYKGSFTKSLLPTSGIVAGDTATITDSTRGLWIYNGSFWKANDSRRVINFLDFCDPATITDCTTQLQAAIDTLDYNIFRGVNGLGGGTIVFPVGHTFKIGGTIDLRAAHSIIFEGANTSGDQNLTTPNIQCTMAGSGACFNLSSAHGIKFRNLFIQYTNPAFTGTVVRFGPLVAGDAQKNFFNNVIFSGTSQASNAESLLDLNLSIIGEVRSCSFLYANKGINGIRPYTPGGNNYSYAYVQQIENNVFNYIKYAIFNPDGLWRIVGNTFEPDQDDSLSAVSNDFPVSVGVYTRAMTFSGNYMGDSPSSSTPFFKASMLGGSITGNWFTLPPNADGIVLTSSSGVSIDANEFENLPHAEVFDNSTVDIAANTVSFFYYDEHGIITTTINPHRFYKGDAITFTTTGTLPAPLAINTTYYVIETNELHQLKVATSYANALAGTAIDLTGGGSGKSSVVAVRGEAAMFLDSANGLNSAISITNNFSQATFFKKQSLYTASLVQFNNTGPGTGSLPNLFPATSFIQKANAAYNDSSVTVGVVGDFTQTGYGAAIRQSDAANADHQAGDLVIHGRTDGNTGAINFVVGTTSKKFSVGAFFNTSYKPFVIGTGGTAINKVLSLAASLDFGATAANSCDDLDVTGFSGLVDGDIVSLGVPVALSNNTGTTMSGFVKDTTTVTVRRCNGAASAASNPAAATVRVSVMQF